MYPVSDLFREAYASGEVQIVTEITPTIGGAPVDIPIELLRGDVAVSQLSPIRRNLGVTLLDADKTIIPEGSLLPTGLEFAVKSGLRLADGTNELFPVGQFRVTGNRSADNQEVDLVGYDLGQTVQTSLTAPFPIYAGTELGAACASVMLRKNPNIITDVPDTLVEVPFTLIDLGDDPLQEVRKLAYAAGYDAYFDALGVFTMTPILYTPALETVWDFVEGEDSRFWSPGKEVNADGVPSVVIVEGNHSSLSSPIRAIVEDTDPTSPTYIHGPYQEVSVTVSSDKVGTVDQCRILGETELIRRGFSETFIFDCVPHAALREGDTISITRERLGLVKQHALITNIRLPLTPEDDMTIQAVSRRRYDDGLSS